MFKKEDKEKVLELILEETKTKDDTYTITHEEAYALFDEFIREKGKSWRWGFYLGLGMSVLVTFIVSKIGE